MSLNFRAAKLTDLPFIVAVYNQTIPKRNATADLEPVTVEDRQAWFAAHNQQTRPLWLIEVAGVPAGWLSLSDFYGRPAYQKTVEISLYLDQPFQHQGLGQKALAYVETQVDRLQIETILAFVFGHNTASQKLFRQQGYTRWGHFPKIAEMDQKKYDLDILGKSF